MTPRAPEQIGIIVVAMGGPNSTRDIPEYLFNIFADREIIRLPGGALLQKPFARLISRLRSKGVIENYNRIGGGSPLLKWTEAQASQLEKTLQQDMAGVRCYVGMRYFKPFISSAVDRAVNDGRRHLVFLPLYPQYSKATVGSSYIVARRAAGSHGNVTADYIDDFHDHAGYVALLKEYIAHNIGDDETLLFSAHSLPQKFVDEGDPYVDQVRKTAAAAAEDREYFLSFQSRTGPVTWVGPDTIDEAKRLLSERQEGLFVVPISFVCDHIETLYEIDQQLPELLGEGAVGRIRRMPMFNDDQRFTEVLADIVRARVMVNAGS